MKKITNWYFGLIFVILVGGLSFFILNRRNQQLSNENQDYLTAVIERGDYIAEIEASGPVKPFQSAQIPWLVSGNIQKVYVENNQYVEEGQILANLNKATLPEEIIMANAELIKARYELKLLLESEAQYADSEIDLAKAQIAVTNTQKALRNLEYQPVTDFILDEVHARYMLAEKTVADLEREYGWAEHSDQITEERANALQKIAEARIALSKAQDDLNQVLKQPKPEKLAQVYAKVEVARASLEESQINWQRIHDNGDGRDPVKVAIAEANVRALEASIARAFLEAPFSGTITAMEMKPGDRVTVGMAGIQIDDLSLLLIDLQISEVDIGFVKVSQPARITFNTLPGKDYNGRIYSVSRVGTSSSDGVFFRVTVILDKPYIDIKPGMTAAVRIKVNEAQNAFAVPNRAIQRIENRDVDVVSNYIYLLKDNRLVKMPVEVRFSTTTSSIINSNGIYEGDRVLLELPKTQ